MTKFKNVSININLLLSDNFAKTAKQIKSPFNDGFTIWIPNKRIWATKYPKYVWIGINPENNYTLFKYNNYEIIETKEILGSDLLIGYQNLKFSNSFKFLHQKEKANNNKIVPIKTNYDFDLKTEPFNNSEKTEDIKQILMDIDKYGN